MQLPPKASKALSAYHKARNVSAVVHRLMNMTLDLDLYLQLGFNRYF